MSQQAIDNILNRCPNEKRIALVKALDNPADLFTLLCQYNWDDGFELPYAVVTHEQCDLGLALMLFWEEAIVQLYYFNPDKYWLNTSASNHEGRLYELNFCKVIVDGIRTQAFKKAVNEYDTGFYGEHLHPENERKAKIRAYKTRIALRRGEFEPVFLQPCFIE
ncbi:DUF4274 domain-containing protein [Suttonella sp. R2A3]|uniref:DUF4274 domain-containing protein n=1 Tax=Suttonella sp. R2A3 TaxID=2908648 RepID=UPI001F3CB09B|nr:DUF4274 domain-containing protein [Suttonella sp. R2A3]UJF25223.1 DUF4274 domain-containing protein [Suttonella sp. R2A3]